MITSTFFLYVANEIFFFFYYKFISCFVSPSCWSPRGIESQIPNHNWCDLLSRAARGDRRIESQIPNHNWWFIPFRMVKSQYITFRLFLMHFRRPKLRAWPVQKVRSLGQMHNCTLVRTFDWNHYTLIHRLHLLKSWYPKLCPTSHRKIMMLQIIYSGSIRCVLQQYLVIPTLTHCSCP